MADEKKCNCCKCGLILLVINTLLLLCICFKLCCPLGKKICPWQKKGTGMMQQEMMKEMPAK